MRVFRAGFVLALLFGAGIAVAQPTPVAVSPKLKTAMEQAQSRLTPKITTEQKPKLQKAARAAASELDAQLHGPKGKSMKTGDVTGIVRKAAMDAGVDFANMPIEDAIMFVMMMIARDAEADLRAQLQEMNEIKKRKEALRDAADRMKEEQAEAKASVRAQYARDRQARAHDALAVQLKVDIADAGAP